MLNGVIGAFLFQPVEKHLKQRVIDENHSLTALTIEIPSTANEDNLSFWRKFVNTMDLGLLDDSRFIILNFVLACGYAVAADFNLILTYFLKVSHESLLSIDYSTKSMLIFRKQQN